MKRLTLILLSLTLLLTSCKEDKDTKIKSEDKYILISSYSTKIFDNNSNRMTNLKICVSVLNGKIIKPLEEFSFNEIVGERTYEKGYKDAITYDEKGEKKIDIGGGICQISSTINMAAKKAGLKITERHDHKHEVPYETIGNDAAVFYNVQDFKFINNLNLSLKLEVILNNDNVTVNIYKKEG